MKVDVGNDGNIGDALTNLFESEGGIVVRHRKANNLASSTDHLFDLRNGLAGVGSVCLGHRLDSNRRAAADLNMFDLYCFRLSHNYLAQSPMSNVQCLANKERRGTLDIGLWTKSFRRRRCRRRVAVGVAPDRSLLQKVVSYHKNHQQNNNDKAH